MSELTKLAVDFAVFMFWIMAGSFIAAAIFYAVAATVEHFTP